MATVAIFVISLHLIAITIMQAQAQPPNRFYGKVTIDGNDQPEGTVVEALIGTTLCGSGAVQTTNSGILYVVDVLGAGQKPNCAADGDTVKFRVAGLDARETASYQTAAATRLDLTAAGTPRQVSQPTVLPPGGGGTPAPAPSFTPTVPQTPAAPAVPSSPPALTTPAVPQASSTPAPAEASATPAVPDTAAPTAPSSTATASSTANTAAARRVERPAATGSSGTSKGWWVVIVLALAAIVFGAIGWRRQRRRG